MQVNKIVRENFVIRSTLPNKSCRWQVLREDDVNEIFEWLIEKVSTWTATRTRRR